MGDKTHSDRNNRSQSGTSYRQWGKPTITSDTHTAQSIIDACLDLLERQKYKRTNNEVKKKSE